MFHLFLKSSSFHSSAFTLWLDTSDLWLLVSWLRAPRWIPAPRTDVCGAELIWPWRFSAPRTETHSHSAANAPAGRETFQNITLHLFTVSSNLFSLFSLLRVAGSLSLFGEMQRDTLDRPPVHHGANTDIHSHPCGQLQSTWAERVWTVGGNWDCGHL